MGIVDSGRGLYSNALFLKVLGCVQSVLKLYEKGGLGILPENFFTEFGTE